LPEHLALIPGDAKLSEAMFVGRVPSPKRPDNERSDCSRADVIAVGCYRACQVSVLLQFLTVGALECIRTGLYVYIINIYYYTIYICIYSNILY